MKKDFLLEIGCENLPSAYLPGGLEQLDRVFAKGLAGDRLDYGSLRVLGTPNRLVVFVQGLDEKQESSEERIVGPPCAIALSADGRYTRAAEGFARSQGIPVESLRRVETKKGEYVAAIRRIRGRSTQAVLKERVPGWIGGLRFPKTMKWDDAGFQFPRPIRWVLSLLGDASPRITIGSLTAGRRTRLSPYSVDFIEVRDIRHYFALMEKKGIVLDPAQRRGIVLELAREAARESGGRLVDDDALVTSVANLLESPVVMAGSFDGKFLGLPRDVIVTALKSHQRYFSVEGRGGKLRPRFIAFADGAARNKREILKGYERVLQARLEDAVFYYQEDTAQPLERMTEKLGGIVWLEGLGTLAQKTDRIGRLAEWLRVQWGIGGSELAASLARAAKLAKADLASEMVKDGKEFTLLQGYIGREYAAASGESGEVAEAIFEHYLPRFSGDRIPATDTGVVLACADKLDTITGCFSLGLEPTGSQDPYALRRHALGLLRILIEREAQVGLPEAIERSIELFAEEKLLTARAEPEALEGRIADFFAQRLSVMLKQEGFDYDLVTAVLAAPWERPYTTVRSVARLQEMRRTGLLTPFVLGMKRIANIIPRERRRPVTGEEAKDALAAFAGGDQRLLGFSSDLFGEPVEGELHEAFSAAAGRLADLGGGDRERAFDILAGIVPTVDRYFDLVLVNCEDEPLRENRISFLHAIHRATGLFCDFSQIVVE